MPMLVGEVRRAIISDGCSCTLSGGSQWSVAVTWVSKNPHVRRASLPRNCNCGCDSTTTARRRGRPSHHISSGDSAHSTSTGAATTSAPGCTLATAIATAAANAGANHIVRNAASRPLPSVRSTSLDGLHCSSRRRDSSIRHSVRAIASRLNQVS